MPFDAPVTMATLPLSLWELIDMIFHFPGYPLGLKNVHRLASVILSQLFGRIFWAIFERVRS